MENENGGVLVYRYDYEKLNIDVEGEFFTRFLQAINSDSTEEPTFQFYLDLPECIYAKHKLYDLFHKYGHLIYWCSNERSYKLHKDIDNEWWSLVHVGNEIKYITLPFWMLREGKRLHLKFTDLLFLGDIYSFQLQEKEYFKSQNIIAKFLGVHKNWVALKIKKYEKLDIVTVTRLPTGNKITLTNSFLNYGNKGENGASGENRKKAPKIQVHQKRRRRRGTRIRRTRQGSGNRKVEGSLSRSKKRALQAG